MSKIKEAENLRFWLDSKFSIMGEREIYTPPEEGWLRAVRESLGITRRQLSAKAGMSQQALSQLETREADGKVQLETLRKAADALDCEVFYVMRPRAGRCHYMYEKRLHKVARRMAAERCADEGLAPGTAEHKALTEVLEYQLPRFISRQALWAGW